MLTEIEGARQIPGEGIRRWFRDEELDLIVWYKDDGSIDGFQLCYDKLDHERALTFRKPNSYQHHAIDSGEPAMGGPKMSPVLVADGVVDGKRIEKIFSRRRGAVPDDLAAYVSRIVLAYPGAW
ncbi:MAG: hypothetical protein JW852_05440 [Spirochaetales bacterium]|nr:hypothetical protein [Spirochaetales bacterium]